MVSNNRFEVPGSSNQESRENYFEAIEKSFKAGDGNLIEIANRKEKEWKLSFFDKVKDFFKNPYAGIKYLSSRLFGEKVTEFMYNVVDAKKNLDQAKADVVEVAKTGVDELKTVIGQIKGELEAIPGVGPMLASANKVKDYLIKNSTEAASMPEDANDRLVWWKSIMKKAGVKEDQLENKTLLELLAKKQNWDDVKENLKKQLTGAEVEEKISKEIESGEFYKNWPFTGEKLGPQSKAALESIKSGVSDVTKIISDNREVTVALGAYLTYKTGIAKTVGVAGNVGKMILSAGLAPLKLTKGNPKKVLALLIGGMLIERNTKWDDAGMKILYNTPLPKDYDEFMKVVSSHPIYKEATKGMEISKKEFEEAMGIVKSEKELQKNIDEIVSNITPQNIVSSALSGIGQTPSERLKYQNFRGYELVKTSVLSDGNMEKLKEKMGGNDYEKFNELMDEIILESRNNASGEVKKDLIDKFNKYQPLTGYEINLGSSNYTQLIYKPSDPVDGIKTRLIGVNPNLDQETKEDLSFTLKLNEDSIVTELGKEVAAYTAIGNAALLKLREIIGVAGENLKDDSLEKIGLDVNQKVKNGEAVVIKEGENFFLKYGTEYVMLPYTVGKSFINAAIHEDYSVKDTAQVYAGGLALVVGIGTTKGLAKHGFDKIYGGLVHGDFSGRVAGRTFGETMKKGFKIATYPISMLLDVGKHGISFNEALKNNGGLKKVISRSDLSILASSMQNISDVTKLRYNELRSSSLLLDKNSLQALDTLNDARNQVIKLRDVKIFTNDIINRNPNGLRGITNEKLTRQLIKRLRETGFSPDLMKILGVSDPEKLLAVSSLTGEQLREILLRVEVALNVEKRILNTISPVSTLRNLRIIKTGTNVVDYAKGTKLVQKVTDARSAYKAAQANRITKATKTAKMVRYGIPGALLGLGAYKLSDSFTEEEKLVNKEKASEELQQLADDILIADDTVVSKVFNFKELKTLVTSDDFDKRKKIVSTAKSDYLNTFNNLVNNISKNRKKYNGKIEVLARLLKERAPYANYKIETKNSYFGESQKILNLGIGTIQLIQNEDGSLVLGRQPVDLLENNLVSIGTFANEGWEGIGKSLLPFVGTYKDFEQGYDAYKMGNKELTAEKISYGVSGLASDFLLGAKAVAGGAKLAGKAGNFKNLQKFAQLASNASDFSKVSKGVGKASRGAGIAAAGVLGLNLLSGDVETYVKIDNG